MPERLRIHEVTVVPTLAPMITVQAWLSFIRPELTKPTTMTVVAEELWMIAVTTRPRRKPFAGFFVSRSRMDCSLFPAWRSRLLPIRSMP